jgi:hypothetical protein
MATNRWIGAGQTIAQVDTLTVASSTNAQTFIATINGKSYTYVAGGAETTTTIATALLALLKASKEGEFLEITWTSAAAVITGTAKTAGVPFTLTSGGTGTLTHAVATANSSPNDVNNAANWSNAAVPANGDTVYADNTNVSLLWNLGSLSGVTVTARFIAQSFTGQIGLPEINANGTPYEEYRPRYWKMGVTTDTIGSGPGSGSSFMKLDYSTIQTACTVLNTGGGTAPNEALEILGTHVSNTFTVLGGSVSLAPLGGGAAKAATLTLSTAAGGNPQVRCGAGVTLTTIVNEGGQLQISSAATTITVSNGGTLVRYGTGAVTTLNLIPLQGGAACQDFGTGTVSTLNSYGGAYDRSGTSAGLTVTNANIYPGTVINDPWGSITWSNAWTFAGGADFSNCTIATGPNRTVLVV